MNGTGSTTSITASWAQSRRLALREFVAGDAGAIVAMHRDPRLRAQLVDDYPLDREEIARLFLKRLAPIYRRDEGLGIWHASVIDAAPRFAGWFSLMAMSERPGEVEIGARLRPEVWGGGLALEGGELLLDHAADTLQLDRLWGVCHPDNRSARAVLAALGFEPAGTHRYDRGTGLYHRIDLNAWRVLRNTPRGTRLRRALRSLAAPDDGPLEEHAHGHDIDADFAAV